MAQKRNTQRCSIVLKMSLQSRFHTQSGCEWRKPTVFFPSSSAFRIIPFCRTEPTEEWFENINIISLAFFLINYSAAGGCLCGCVYASMRVCAVIFVCHGEWKIFFEICFLIKTHSATGNFPCIFSPVPLWLNTNKVFQQICCEVTVIVTVCRDNNIINNNGKTSLKSTIQNNLLFACVSDVTVTSNGRKGCKKWLTCYFWHSHRNKWKHNNHTSFTDSFESFDSKNSDCNAIYRKSKGKQLKEKKKRLIWHFA